MKVLASFVGTLVLTGIAVIAFGLAPNAARWGLVDEPAPEPAKPLIITWEVLP